MFGEELRALRVTAGMDLQTLARRSGVSASYLSRLEAGKRGIPTLTVLIRLARGLDAPLSDLLHLAGVETEALSHLREPDPFGLPASIRRVLARAVGIFTPDDWRDVESVLEAKLSAHQSDS